MSGYRLTKSAEADLVDILEYIADRDGIDRALHVHEQFVEAFEAVAASPGIGVRKPDLTADPIRWWPVFRFLVVYDAERAPNRHPARDPRRSRSRSGVSGAIAASADLEGMRVDRLGISDGQ